MDKEKELEKALDIVLEEITRNTKFDISEYKNLIEDTLKEISNKFAKVFGLEFRNKIKFEQLDSGYVWFNTETIETAMYYDSRVENLSEEYEEIEFHFYIFNNFFWRFEFEFKKPKTLTEATVYIFEDRPSKVEVSNCSEEREKKLKELEKETKKKLENLVDKIMLKKNSKEEILKSFKYNIKGKEYNIQLVSFPSKNLYQVRIIRIDKKAFGLHKIPKIIFQKYYVDLKEAEDTYEKELKKIKRNFKI